MMKRLFASFCLFICLAFLPLSSTAMVCRQSSSLTESVSDYSAISSVEYSAYFSSKTCGNDPIDFIDPNGLMTGREMIEKIQGLERSIFIGGTDGSVVASMAEMHKLRVRRRMSSDERTMRSTASSLKVLWPNLMM